MVKIMIFRRTILQENLFWRQIHRCYLYFVADANNRTEVVPSQEAPGESIHKAPLSLALTKRKGEERNRNHICNYLEQDKAEGNLAEDILAEDNTVGDNHVEDNLIEDYNPVADILELDNPAEGNFAVVEAVDIVVL
ncbi:uncharacterized protein A4U43_C08F1110 [Asparagus officinalis]|nr:uncharacterized protein A4U43_C08F1110 [Asparagus officinalis]